MLNLDPKDCIVVEDALSGLEAGYRAGAGMIIAMASMESDELYKKIPYVDRIIHDFGEIGKLFNVVKSEK